MALISAVLITYLGHLRSTLISWWKVSEVHVMYQVKKTVFDHIYKHRGSSWEYDVQRQTLFLLFSMLSVSRTCFNEFLSLLDVAWVNKVLLLLLLLRYPWWFSQLGSQVSRHGIIYTTSITIDIDECKYNNSCDSIEHSYCINEEKIVRGDDGYDCLCKTGYRKVGKSCVSQGKQTSGTISYASTNLDITFHKPHQATGLGQTSWKAGHDDVSWRHYADVTTFRGTSWLNNGLQGWYYACVKDISRH